MGFDGTGIDIVDGDHRRIMDSLRGLLTLVRGDHDAAVACKVLTIVLDDMEEHCRREEGVARDMRMDGDAIARLQKAHREVMDEYRKVRQSIGNSDGCCSEVALVERLMRLTAAHMGEVDAPLFGKWRRGKPLRTAAAV